MNEFEKIKRAEMYLEKLANGINPLTDEEVSEGDIVNNVRISRCIFYVSGILKQIIDNDGKFKVDKPEKLPFTLSSEQISGFKYSEAPLLITEITKRLNSLIDPLYVKEIKMGAITDWLIDKNILSNIVVNNKKRKRPTELGRMIGISTEDRVNKYGISYEAVIYDFNAQHYIVDNIESIAERNNQKDK